MRKYIVSSPFLPLEATSNIIAPQKSDIQFLCRGQEPKKLDRYRLKVYTVRVIKNPIYGLDFRGDVEGLQGQVYPARRLQRRRGVAPGAGI